MANKLFQLITSGVNRIRGVSVKTKVIAATGVTAVGAGYVVGKIANYDDGKLKSSDSIENENKQGTANKTEDTSKPDKDDLIYPNDLGSSNRYPHFVLFHINANTKSTMFNAQKDTAKDLTKNNSVPGGTESLALGAGKLIGSLGTSKETQNSWIASHKRLKKSIALPMPMSVKTDYGTNYDKISSGGIIGSFFNKLAEGGVTEATEGMLMDLLVQGTNMSVNIGSQAIGGVASKVLTGSSAAGTVAGAKFAKNAQGVVQKLSGYAVNERLEQMFKSVNFREFSFDYVFAPRSSEESNTIKEIIKKFKYHMMPEVLDSHNQFFVMPDEFDIEMRFSTGDKSEVNNFIHKIMTCVLTDVHVDYSPNGHWSSFEDGSPTMIAVSLKFRELEPLIRNMIDSGF